MFPLTPSFQKLVQRKYQRVNLFSLLFFFILLSEFSKKTAAETSPKDPAADSIPTLDVPDFFGTVFGVSVRNPALILELPLTWVEEQLTKIVSKEEYMNVVGKCNEAISEILTEKVWIPRGEFVKDLKTKNLTISLCPDGGNPYLSTGGAVYFDTLGTALISYSSHRTKEGYKKLILNELMHHFVTKSHKRCRIFPEDNALPFLNHRGEVDPALKESLIASINSGSAMIDKLHHLWHRRAEKKLEPSEKKLLSQFLAAVKHYTPVDNNIDYSYDISNLQQDIAKGWFKMQDAHITPGPHYPSNRRPFLYAWIHNGHLILCHYGNQLPLKKRIFAFFERLHNIGHELNSPEGGYFRHTENRKLAELASFNMELPESLLDLLFKDFRKLTQQYLLRCKPEEEREASQRSAETPRVHSFFPKVESSKNKRNEYKPAFKPQPKHEKHKSDKPSFQRKSLHR